MRVDLSEAKVIALDNVYRGSIYGVRLDRRDQFVMLDICGGKKPRVWRSDPRSLMANPYHKRGTLRVLEAFPEPDVEQLTEALEGLMNALEKRRAGGSLPQKVQEAYDHAAELLRSVANEAPA